MKKKRSHWDIFPEELFQGLRIILPVTFGGIYHYPNRSDDGDRCILCSHITGADGNTRHGRLPGRRHNYFRCGTSCHAATDGSAGRHLFRKFPQGSKRVSR